MWVLQRTYSLVLADTVQNLGTAREARAQGTAEEGQGTLGRSRHADGTIRGHRAGGLASRQATDERGEASTRSVRTVAPEPPHQAQEARAATPWSLQTVDAPGWEGNKLLGSH